MCCFRRERQDLRPAFRDPERETNESFRLPDVEYTKFDAEENEFTISLPAAHHVIRGAFFESSDAFDAFKSTFK